MANNLNEHRLLFYDKLQEMLFCILVRVWVIKVIINVSRIMRKPAFCICENKDAD